MSQVSLGRPEFVPGTPPGHPTAKFLYVIFLYRFFSLHNKHKLLGLVALGTTRGLSQRQTQFVPGTNPGFLLNFILRVRQRSGEGVVRSNGCPKGCFWRVRFFSAPLRFALKTPEKVLKTLREQGRNRLSKNTLLDNRFSARRLRRSFGALPYTVEAQFAPGASAVFPSDKPGSRKSLCVKVYVPFVRSRSGTLALKTGHFSKKIGRL